MKKKASEVNSDAFLCNMKFLQISYYIKSRRAGCTRALCNVPEKLAASRKSLLCKLREFRKRNSFLIYLSWTGSERSEKDMTVRKKFLLIAACIVIMAIIVVIFVECFQNGQPSEFDGTLVDSLVERMKEG